MPDNYISQVQGVDGTIFDIKAAALKDNTNIKTLNNETLIGSGNIDINEVRYYTATGTAAVVSSPYTSAKWDVSTTDVSALYDGLTIIIKVPVAGDVTYGTVLQLGSLGYHPVTRLVTSMIGTRYGVGAAVMLVYVSTATGTWYNNSATSTTTTGCWVCVNDVDDPPIATSSEAGIVKLGSDTIQTVPAGSVSTETNRTYAIQKNSSNQMVVNVPWTDTTNFVDLTTNQEVDGKKTFLQRPRFGVYHVPNTFEELDYIITNGSSYINTNHKYNTNEKIILTFQQNNTSTYRIWGTFNQSGYSGQNVSMTYSSGWCVRYETTTNQARLVALTSIDTKKHTLIIENDGTIYFDGYGYGKSAGYTANFTFNYNAYLGTINPGGTTPSANLQGRLYYYAVIDSNGDFIQEMYPAKRKSDNAVGMYDVENDQFYTSITATPFTVGSTFLPSEFLVEADLASVATSGNYNDLMNKPSIGNGTLTITAGTNTTSFTANQSGNSSITITASDLGLSQAMKFIGISTTDPKTSGATVSGHTTWVKGEIVLYKRSGETNYEEYINITGGNTASAWELLGDSDSYALNSIQINGADGVVGGGDLTQNRTLKADLANYTKLTSASAIETEVNNRVYSTQLDKDGHLATNVPWTDTLNTAGSSNSTQKLYLVGAPSQTDGTQTFSSEKIYATDDTLTTTEIDLQKVKAPSSSGSSTLSYGTSGQVLKTNGSGAYWATDENGVTSIATGTGLYGGTITSTGTLSLKTASSSEIGGVKVSSTEQTTSANVVTSTASRTYAVQLDSNSNAVVNVPWTDTTNFVDLTSDQTIGGEKTFTTIPLVDVTRLPATYQEIEYAIFNGTNYVDSGIKLTSTAKYKIKFTINSSTAAYGLIGIMPTGQTAKYHYIVKNSNATNLTWYYRNNGVAYTNCNWAPDTIYTIEVDGNKLYFNGALVITQTAATFTDETNAYVGNRNSGTTNGLNGRLYEFTITNSGTNYDFVPCYRVSDDVLGYYELTTETFFPVYDYSAAGTTTYSEGVNGGPEIHATQLLTGNDITLQAVTDAGNYTTKSISTGGDLIVRGSTSSSTTSSQIQFRSATDNSKTGYFTSNTSNQFIIGLGNASYFNFNMTSLRPVSGISTLDLGESGTPFRNLYLSTNVNLGGNIIKGGKTYTIPSKSSNDTFAMLSDIPSATVATSSALGVIKLGSDTQQTTAANAVTSTSSRTYAVQLNSNNQAVVNVPWANDNVLQESLNSSTNGEYPLLTKPNPSTSSMTASVAFSTDFKINPYLNQLKTTTGKISAADLIATTSVKTPAVYAPTTSGGTTYGLGNSGQVLISDGSGVYWGTIDTATSVIYTPTSSTSGGRGDFYFSCTKTGTEIGNLISSGAPFDTYIHDENNLLSLGYSVWVKGNTSYVNGRLITFCLFDYGIADPVTKEIWIDDDRWQVYDYGDIQGSVKDFSSGSSYEKPMYLLSDGDQIIEAFFNVNADIGPYLPFLPYDQTTSGLDWCYVGLDYLCAADLSSVGLGNGYLLYWGENSQFIPIYSTIAFDASQLIPGLVVDEAGWQLDHLTFGSTITVDFSDMNQMFLRIMDRVVAKAAIAFDTIDVHTPQVGTITLSTTWSGNGPYTQTVTVNYATVTKNSKIDLQPDAASLAQLISDGVSALFIENNNTTLTAYAIGSPTTTSLTLQCVVTEVESHITPATATVTIDNSPGGYGLEYVYTNENEQVVHVTSDAHSTITLTVHTGTILTLITGDSTVGGPITSCTAEYEQLNDVPGGGGQSFYAIKIINDATIVIDA